MTHTAVYWLHGLQLDTFGDGILVIASLQCLQIVIHLMQKTSMRSWRMERMSDRKVRKLQRRIRKLHWYQKMILMDWMNAWYSDVKEQRRLEEE